MAALGKNTDRIKRLVKYIEEVKIKLNSQVPPKFQDRPAIYKDLWTRELEKATKDLERENA